MRPHRLYIHPKSKDYVLLATRPCDCCKKRLHYDTLAVHRVMHSRKRAPKVEILCQFCLQRMRPITEAEEWIPCLVVDRVPHEYQPVILMPLTMRKTAISTFEATTQESEYTEDYAIRSRRWESIEGAQVGDASQIENMQDMSLIEFFNHEAEKVSPDAALDHLRRIATAIPYTEKPQLEVK